MDFIYDFVWIGKIKIDYYKIIVSVSSPSTFIQRLIVVVNQSQFHNSGSGNLGFFGKAAPIKFYSV